MLAVLALKQPAIECLTLRVLLGWMELPSAIVIRAEDSGAAFEQKTESLDVLAWLKVNP